MPPQKSRPIMISLEDEPKPKKVCQPPPSFSSLPDEIVENILARVSRWSYPSLSLVSKRFHSLLSSPQIYKTRSHIGTQERCFYACLRFLDHPNHSWFSLWTKPNQTRKKRKTKIRFKHDPSGTSVIPTPFSSSYSPPIPNQLVANGSEIYVIGGSNANSSPSIWVLDCRTHTWREAPNMTVAREDPCVNVLDEKIYVMGGCDIDKYSASWFEVFDIKTQSWTALPGPGAEEAELRNHLRKNYTYDVDFDFEGNFYVSTKGGYYTYHTKNGAWEMVRKKIIKHVWLENEHILYGCNHSMHLMWYDFFLVNKESRKWREIKGLEKLYDNRKWRLSNKNMIDMDYQDEKLVVMWDPYVRERLSGVKRKNNIWYAKISLEIRSSSSSNGRDIWGKVECVDVITFPGDQSFEFLGCHADSV